MLDYEGIPFRCRKCHKQSHIASECQLPMQSKGKDHASFPQKKRGASQIEESSSTPSLKQGKALSSSENAPVQEIRDGKHKSIRVSSYFSDSVSSLGHGISEKVATSTMDFSQGIISHLGMPARSLPSLNYSFQSLSFLVRTWLGS